MASAVFPVYLLGRQVLPRAWAVAVAGLSVLVPWMVLTGFVMTESAAYPAFAWALLGLHSAIAAPSSRRDLLAVAALGLAVLARTQFAVLVVVLPVGDPRARAHAEAPGGRARGSSHRGSRAPSCSPLFYAAGLALALILALTGSLGNLLGVYGSRSRKGLCCPSGVWSSAGRHLDAVAIGCGLVPLILGGGWMLATLVRPPSKRAHALATLSLVTIVLLTFEAASFSVRFGDAVVRDRYLFYVVPLLLIGVRGGAAQACDRQAVAVGAALVTILFAATAAQLPFTTYPGVWVDSPASVLNECLIEQSGELGTGTFVALARLSSRASCSSSRCCSRRGRRSRSSRSSRSLAFSIAHAPERGRPHRHGHGTERSPPRRPARPRPRLGGHRRARRRERRARRVPGLHRVGHDRDPLVGRGVLEPARHARVRRRRTGTSGTRPSRTARSSSTGRAERSTGTEIAPRYVVEAPGDSRFLARRPRASGEPRLRRQVGRASVPRALGEPRAPGGRLDDSRPDRRRSGVRRARPHRARSPADHRSRATDLAPATYRLSAAGDPTVRLRAGREEGGDVRICLRAGSIADFGSPSPSSTRSQACSSARKWTRPRAVGVNVGPVSVRPSRRVLAWRRGALASPLHRRRAENASRGCSFRDPSAERCSSISRRARRWGITGCTSARSSRSSPESSRSGRRRVGGVRRGDAPHLRARRDSPRARADTRAHRSPARALARRRPLPRG